MRRVSSCLLGCSLAFALAATLRSVAAEEQILVHFDLPAQPLGQSLKAIATATNTDVGFNSSQVAGLMAPPLKADLTLDGALARVLLGTGLRPRHLDDHTVVVAGKDSPVPDAGEIRPAQTKSSAPPADSDNSIRTPNAAGSSDPLRLAQANPSASDEASDAENKNNRASAAQLAEIVVTGSHIRGIENKTNPVIVIDQAQIEQSGYSSTQDLFRSLPQNFSSGATTQDGFVGNGGNNAEFASGINLRGLGSSSTLVLLNGHRLAPAVEGSVVDVSMIPLAAIERIEIVTDGASAIYGSDAVGGVVNIITKKNYDGAETAARFGSVTAGSRKEELFAQTLGHDWSTGNVTATFQYQNHSDLNAKDRDFSAELPSPSDLLPDEHAYSAMLSARQQLASQITIYTDALWSKRAFNDYLSYALPGVGNTISTNTGDAEAVNVAAGVRYDLAPKWSVELNGLYARQDSVATQLYTGVGPLVATFGSKFGERSLELLVNGAAAQTAAGDVGVAVGASSRTEDPELTQFDDGADIFEARPSRTVRAYYGEVYAPIVAEQNSWPFLRALDVSAALRTDRYSDFGSTTNPRLGVRWSPFGGLSFRASYGRSFRAPTVGELISGASPVVEIASFANPNGPGSVPVIESDVREPLTAERARSIDLGLEYIPPDYRGIDITLNYYDIRYSNRIVQVFPPYNALQSPNIYGQLITPLASDAAAQAYIDSAVASGATLYDLVGTGAAGVRYVFNASLQNASLVVQSGVDIGAKWVKEFAAGTFVAQLNGTFVDKIDTAYSAGASFANLVGTYGNPPRWRTRETAAWATVGWEVNGAISTVGHYLNTEAVGNPPVSSWTTIDLGARLHAEHYFRGSGWKGLTVALSALNVLNRDPPHIAPTTTANPIAYDPNNANPLGRYIALELRKAW